jgi:hypothetical protein
MFDNSVLDKSVQISDIQQFLLGKDDDENISFKMTENSNLLLSQDEQSILSELKIEEQKPERSLKKILFKLLFLLSFPILIKNFLWLFEDFAPASPSQEF